MILKTTLVLLITCSFSFPNLNSTRELRMVRTGFYEAVQDSKKAKPLSKIISNFNSNSPIIKVYEGANLAIMAKNKWNPFVAIKFLKKSKGMMNIGIKKSPKNIEIRFIRFAVQKNIPEFLGLSENLEEDKEFIIQNITKFDGSTLNKDMKGYILDFMIEQGAFTPQQVEQLKKKLT